MPFLAYAAQVFIGLMARVAWQLSTQRAKRNTLQLKDLKAAVYASSQFDFLFDVIDAFEHDHPQPDNKRAKTSEPFKMPGVAHNGQVPPTPSTDNLFV